MKFQLINLIYFLFILTLVSSKHRTHKYSCPITKKCPVHKHKICGSDGKLYDSHCHLRKASCDRGVTLRAVHPDQCDSNDDNNIESTVVEDCEPKQYDLMKQQLLQKAGNDASLLFTQLDENNDGSININELWRKSAFYRPADNSPCILTDLLQHEDKNQDDFLDFNEFQNSFNNLYTITMVTLDQSLAVNTIQAHIGDNVEIRCDIVGNPQQPVIKWHRHNVDLSTISIPNVKVFSDGSLYLTNVQVPLSGNYTCSAENNPVIKQTHILHVIVPPIVEVTPHFQWSAVGGKASIDCQYESLDEKLDVSWFKNNEIIEPNERTSLTSNRTRLTMSQLSRSDTGAYSCRVTNRGDAALGQDTTSLLVQDEPVGSSPNIKYKQKLWVFHSSGVSVFTEGCSGLLHEMDARDTIPLNGQPLCGSLALRGEPCSWSENGVIVNSKIYIGQPELNRIIVFHIQQLNVIHIIATDPRPTSLWLVRGETEDRIWILNYGQKEFSEPQRRKNAAGGSSDSQGEMKSSLLSTDTVDSSSPDADAVAAASAVETAADEDGDIDIDKYIKDNFRGSWDLSSSREQQKHNRKTVQIIRISQGGQNHNVIHLQPIDGHFDLVYNLFIPQPSTITLHHSVDNARYAYVTHWDERTLVKIDMEQFRYVKTINLADCQPINAVFTDYGLVILQCQTPVTHQLNGQLIIDQLTDSIISYNAHIKSHRTFLSPNHQFLVNIFHNSSTTSPVSTTIIVQKVTANGLEFLYDVRTTLSIVNCDFVWKNGNYDALLASGTLNREDLLYLSLVDGRVELISGIGRPTKGSHRSMAVSRISRTGAITSAESVFIIDLNSNMVQCETQEHRQEPSILMWT